MLRLIVDNTGGPRPALEPAGEPAPVRRPSDPCTILVVDPDPLLREILAASLRLHDARYTVLAVEAPEKAIATLTSLGVDLVITEVLFPRLSLEAGTAYVERLRRAFSHLPVLLLTEALSGVTHLDAIDGVLAKPPDMDELLRRVDSLLDRSRESVVRGISLVSLLQVLELERKSCTLAVEERGRAGRLRLRDGRLAHAEAGPARGKEALFEMLSWAAPILRISDRSEGPVTIEGGIQELLLEYFIEEDHGRRG